MPAEALPKSLAAWRDTQDSFAWQDSAGRLAPCLEQLEPVRRNCILHAYVDGLSHSEIAAETGLPLGTIKSRIRLALDKLQQPAREVAAEGC